MTCIRLGIYRRAGSVKVCNDSVFKQHGLVPLQLGD